MIKRTVLIVLLLTLGVAGGWLWFQNWAPSRETFPTQGIDVSHHQGEIDWKAAFASGVDFAYIKASEGGDFRDDRFAANWAGAKEAGVNRGAYHFYSLCRPGADQATNFIAMVPRDADALPPALDLEFGGNCAARPARAALLAQLDAFIRMVEAHSERPVMLYITQEFEEAYRVSAGVDRPLWLRRILFEPDYGSHPWVMWQASNRRKIEGIAGPVDWNVVRP